ncbi:unnamed protein product [Closterium sp. NIES-53]
MKKRSGKQSASSLVAIRFDFKVHLIELRPWLRMGAPAIIQWQRGDKRTGFSKPVRAQRDEGGADENAFKVVIDQTFRVPATLYRERGGPGAPYQRKTAAFSIHEAQADDSAQPKPTALGKASLDLSAFADCAGVLPHALPVQVSKSLGAALGRPELHLTVECVGKKLSKEAAAEEAGAGALPRFYPTKLEPLEDAEDTAGSSGDETCYSDAAGSVTGGGGSRLGPLSDHGGSDSEHMRAGGAHGTHGAHGGHGGKGSGREHTRKDSGASSGGHENQSSDTEMVRRGSGPRRGHAGGYEDQGSSTPGSAAGSAAGSASGSPKRAGEGSRTLKGAPGSAREGRGAGRSEKGRGRDRRRFSGGEMDLSLAFQASAGGARAQGAGGGGLPPVGGVGAGEAGLGGRMASLPVGGGVDGAMDDAWAQNAWEEGEEGEDGRGEGLEEGEDEGGHDGFGEEEGEAEIEGGSFEDLNDAFGNMGGGNMGGGGKGRGGGGEAADMHDVYSHDIYVHDPQGTHGDDGDDGGLEDMYGHHDMHDMYGHHGIGRGMGMGMGREEQEEEEVREEELEDLSLAYERGGPGQLHGGGMGLDGGMGTRKGGRQQQQQQQGDGEDYWGEEQEGEQGGMQEGYGHGRGYPGGEGYGQGEEDYGDGGYEEGENGEEGGYGQGHGQGQGHEHGHGQGKKRQGRGGYDDAEGEYVQVDEREGEEGEEGEYMQDGDGGDGYNDGTGMNGGEGEYDEAFGFEQRQGSYGRAIDRYGDQQAGYEDGYAEEAYGDGYVEHGNERAGGEEEQDEQQQAEEEQEEEEEEEEEFETLPPPPPKSPRFRQRSLDGKDPAGAGAGGGMSPFGDGLLYGLTSPSSPAGDLFPVNLKKPMPYVGGALGIDAVTASPPRAASSGGAGGSGSESGSTGGGGGGSGGRGGPGVLGQSKSMKVVGERAGEREEERGGGDASSLEFEWRKVRTEKKLVEEEKRALQTLGDEVQRLRVWAENERARLKKEHTQIEMDKKRCSELESQMAEFSAWSEAEEERIRREREEAEQMKGAAEAAERRVREERERFEWEQQRVAEEKMHLDEAAASVAEALARAAEAEERARSAERNFGRLPGDLRDAAMADVAVYAVRPDHGGSVRRVHTPARRIARAYAFVRVHEGDERVGGVARVAVTALTLVSKAAADDAARLLFWWSNTVMLREAIASIAPTEAHSDEPHSANSSSSSSFPLSDRTSSGSEPDSEPGGGSGPGKRGGRGGKGGGGGAGEGAGGGGGGRESWGSPGAVVAALRRLEEWQHERCLQLVWRKVFLPALRRPPTSQPSTSSSSSASTLSAASSLFSSLASAASTSASSLPWPGGSTVGGALGLGGQKKPAAPVAGGVGVHLPKANPFSAPLASLSSPIVSPFLPTPLSKLTCPFSLSTLFSSHQPISSHPTPSSPLINPSPPIPHPSSPHQPISSHPTPLFLPDAERAPWWSKLVGVERWRAVLHDASFSLCPQRAMGRCCGCLYLLEKQVRPCLNAIFNALLRSNPDAPPAAPLADPVTEPAALPFTATGKLTYSHGMHLKYATSAWATMFHDLDAHMHAQIDYLLTSSHPPNPSAPLPTPPPFSSSLLATTTAFWAGALDPSDPSPSSSPSFFSSSSSSSSASSATHPASPRFPPSAAAAAGAAVAVTGGPGECFPKLRAMAQVLLLPKDLLADQEARKEVCGDLTLALLRRILLIFAPDANAPDPVSSTLLQQLNSEVHSESRRGKANPSTDLAPLPATPYTPPPSPSIRLLLGSVRLLHLSHAGSSGLALDRGYDSDEELRLVESPADLLSHMLLELDRGGSAGAGGGGGGGGGGAIGKGGAGRGATAGGKARVVGHRDGYKSSGYQLLADMWSRQAAAGSGSSASSSQASAGSGAW